MIQNVCMLYTSTFNHYNCISWLQKSHSCWLPLGHIENKTILITTTWNKNFNMFCFRTLTANCATSFFFSSSLFFRTTTSAACLPLTSTTFLRASTMSFSICIFSLFSSAFSFFNPHTLSQRSNSKGLKNEGFPDHATAKNCNHQPTPTKNGTQIKVKSNQINYNTHKYI